MERLRNLYIGLVFAVLSAPLLCVTGSRGFVKVAGYERKAPRPTRTAQAFLDGTFQNELKAYYDRKYFGRGELLKFKHLIFDVVNLGQYHAGYSGNVIQGRDGFLFERGYLDVYFNPPTKYHTPAHFRRLAKTAAALQRAIEARGAVFGIILAPSKTEACPAFMPTRYRRFNRAPADFDLYTGPWRAYASAGIPCVNGAELCQPFLNTDAMFPYTGTHWSVFCAAMAATNLVGQINAGPATTPLPSPTILGMKYQPKPYDPTDRDIADLLNLPIPYRRQPDRYPPSDFRTTDRPPWQGRRPGRQLLREP